MRNQSRQWVLTLCLLGLWLLSSGLPLLSPASVANAQEGENLLLNPYFDHGYSPVANGIAPTHWSVWGNADNSDKEGLGTLTHSPPYSWRFRKEWGLFTGGGYYTATVQPGTTYEFSIFAMIWTCDDEERACRSEDSTFSHTDSGGRVRIGIDPTGGTNPHSGNIRWSEWRAPFTWGVFDYITVQATATGSQMTVFTYYTADKAMRWHDVFWDDAALRAVSPANPPDNQDDDNTGSPENTQSQPTTRPRATAVPIEPNAQERADGALVHIVRPGQSLWTISQAYDVPLDQLRELNDMQDTSIIYTGQEIVVQAPSGSEAPAPTATTAPTLASTAETTATATVTRFVPTTQTPTVIARDISEPTLEPVRVETSTGDNGGDSDTLRAGVVALAVVVVILGTVGIGGVLYVVGMSVFRSRA